MYGTGFQMESISPANDIKILLRMCNSRKWKIVSTSTEAQRQFVKLPTSEELSVNGSVCDTSNSTAAANTRHISHKSLIYMETPRHVEYFTQEPNIHGNTMTRGTCHTSA